MKVFKLLKGSKILNKRVIYLNILIKILCQKLEVWRNIYLKSVKM